MFLHGGDDDVIDGVNLLEKFMESVGKVMERLR